VGVRYGGLGVDRDHFRDVAEMVQQITLKSVSFWKMFQSVRYRETECLK